VKFCTTCKLDKPLTGFNKNKSRKDGLQSRCRDCQKSQNNLGYILNPNRKASCQKARDKLKGWNKRLVNRYKSYMGCSCCGEEEPCVLDFHHLDPQFKEDGLAKLVGYSTKRLKEEIRKCIVLCSNCHRKVHAGVL
jgi:hypothetical protein